MLGWKFRPWIGLFIAAMFMFNATPLNHYRDQRYAHMDNGMLANVAGFGILGFLIGIGLGRFVDIGNPRKREWRFTTKGLLFAVASLSTLIVLYGKAYGILSLIIPTT